MGKTFRRPPIKQHRDLLEDDRYRPAVIDTKKHKLRDRKLTKRELELELAEGYEYDSIKDMARGE